MWLLPRAVIQQEFHRLQKLIVIEGHLKVAEMRIIQLPTLLWKIRRSFFEDPMHRYTYRVFVTTFYVMVVPLAVVALVGVFFGVQMPFLMRDVTALADVHPLTGVMSNCGILLWWSSASIWLFSAMIHRARHSRESFGFALSSGLLSAYLAMDDLFQFHEYLAPHHLKIPEGAVYGALAACMAVYLLAFYRLFMRRDGVLILLSLILLSVSAGIDGLFRGAMSGMGH